MVTTTVPQVGHTSCRCAACCRVARSAAISRLTPRTHIFVHDLLTKLRARAKHGGLGQPWSSCLGSSVLCVHCTQKPALRPHCFLENSSCPRSMSQRLQRRAATQELQTRVKVALLFCCWKSREGLPLQTVTAAPWLAVIAAPRNAFLAYYCFVGSTPLKVREENFPQFLQTINAFARCVVARPTCAPVWSIAANIPGANRVLHEGLLENPQAGRLE